MGHINYASHPNVFRVDRTILDTSWFDEFQYALWDYGKVQNPGHALPNRFTILGRGEVGAKLNNVGKLGSFPVALACERIYESLGQSFRKPLEVKTQGVDVDSFWAPGKRSAFLTINVESDEILDERSIATSVVDTMVGEPLEWSDIRQARLKIHQLLPDAELSKDALEYLNNALPDVLVLSAGQVRYNGQRD